MLYYRVQDPMIEMPEGEPSAEEVNAQVLRALRTTGIVNAREDVVEGLDQGFLGRFGCGAAGTEKGRQLFGAFERFGRDGFSGGIGICGAENRQAGRQILDGKIALDPYEQGNRKRLRILRVPESVRI